MTTMAGSRTSCSNDRATTVASRDGRIRFVVRAIRGGVYLQRDVQCPRTGHLTQAVIFETPESFRRWRDADPLRFDSPVLHASLARAAELAFRTAETDAAVG